MAAGFITKTLATLLSSAARWVEFADGLTAPVHGSIAIDPVTGLPLPAPPSAAVTLTDLYGVPIDGEAVTGSGAAVNDILIDIDTRFAKAIYMDFMQVGANTTVVCETTLDGGAWKRVPATNISNFVTSPTFDIFPSVTVRFAANVAGSARTRLRLSTSPAGPCTVVVKASGEKVPEAFFLVRASGAKLDPTQFRGNFKTSGGSLTSYDLLNTTAGIRYLHIYNKAALPTPGTDTSLFCVPLAANGSARLALPAPVAAGSGLGWAITTDAAGNTAGAAGDVVGSATVL